jgi:hypothetical protein
MSAPPPAQTKANGAPVPIDADVGIVFLVGDALFIESTPVSEVAVFAGCKDHEGSHISYWEQLQCSQLVPDFLDFDQVARGRVVFRVETPRFFLMLDGCIRQRRDLIKEIVRRFRLAAYRYDVISDSHYRCPNCLKN